MHICRLAYNLTLMRDLEYHRFYTRSCVLPVYAHWLRVCPISDSSDDVQVQPAAPKRTPASGSAALLQRMKSKLTSLRSGAAAPREAGLQDDESEGEQFEIMRAELAASSGVWGCRGELSRASLNKRLFCRILIQGQTWGRMIALMNYLIRFILQFQPHRSRFAPTCMQSCRR